MQDTKYTLTIHTHTVTQIDKSLFWTDKIVFHFILVDKGFMYKINYPSDLVRLSCTMRYYN